MLLTPPPAGPATADTAPPALQTSALTLRRRNGPPVLDAVSLAVPAGSVLGLVGRNGAGKSSLIRCLVGLTVPDAGSASVLGAPSVALPDAVRVRLGYVAQTPDLFDWLTGEQHLQRFASLYPGYDRPRALRLAQRLELPLHVRARQLSGGDQQKLSVLLALAHDPDVLVLDEPVASLDPISRRDFLRALFERQDADRPPRSVLLSSHLLSDLERICTHLVFLRSGRVQLADTWDALAEHLRVAEAPPNAPGWPEVPGLVHRRLLGDGRERVLFDARHAASQPAAGRALALEDLFAELNA